MSPTTAWTIPPPSDPAKASVPPTSDARESIEDSMELYRLRTFSSAGAVGESIGRTFLREHAGREEGTRWLSPGLGKGRRGSRARSHLSVDAINRPMASTQVTAKS